LHIGGLVTMVNGQRVDSVDALHSAVAALPPGKEAKFTVIVDGQGVPVTRVVGTPQQQQLQKPEGGKPSGTAPAARHGAQAQQRVPVHGETRKVALSGDASGRRVW
jgi:hypothetical protein